MWAPLHTLKSAEWYLLFLTSLLSTLSKSSRNRGALFLGGDFLEPSVDREDWVEVAMMLSVTSEPSHPAVCHLSHQISRLTYKSFGEPEEQGSSSMLSAAPAFGLLWWFLCGFKGGNVDTLPAYWSGGRHSAILIVVGTLQGTIAGCARDSSAILLSGHP